MTRHDEPSIRTVPIGIDASGTRCETDSMGAIDVPADRYWGAQTQRSLIHFCIGGEQINQYVDRSLMLVTALSPVIGYDKASAIAHDADRSGRTLREAALDCGAIGAEDFDRIVNPANMVGPF